MSGAMRIDTRTRLSVSIFSSLGGLTGTVIARGESVSGQPWVSEGSYETVGSYVGSSVLLDLPRGWLRGVCVRDSSGGIELGSVYVRVELLDSEPGSGGASALVCQGYLSTRAAVGWPGSGNVSSYNGPGLQAGIYVTVVDPAAGVDWSTTVPASTRWWVHAVSARFVTDANVASRRPVLTATFGGVRLVSAISTSSLAASQTTEMCWGVGVVSAGSGGLTMSTPSASLWLRGGVVIGSATANLQVGDQWSNIRLVVSEAPQLGP